MRICLFLFISLIVFCSCTKEKNPHSKQVLEIYSEEDFYSKVKVIDTFCISERKRVKQDIKNGKVMLNNIELYHRPGYAPKRYFSGEGEKFVIDELAKLNIGIDTTLILHSSLHSITDGLFKHDCYQSEMADEAYSILKFHSISLDTLIKKAERQYVLNNPNRIFILDERDFGNNSVNNTFEDFRTKSEVVFKENFVYPGDYKPKNESSYSYTTADFVLMKDSTIKNLTVESTFQNPYNNRFREYFEKEVRDFVLATKWVHPKSSGIIVNSEMSFTFYHK